MSLSMLGKSKITIETSNLSDGDSIAAYLVSAAGALITSTTIGAKEHEDVLDAASHLQGSAYAPGTDWLSSVGVVDNSGNWVPFTLNAAGELPVSATVDFAGDYATGSVHGATDIGLYGLTVRRDVRAVDAGVADGDYASFSVNSIGELWVHDEDVLAQLVTANSTLSTISTNTGNTATNTSNINTNLLAISKAEDAVAVSGDLGVMGLAVRKDSQGSNVSNDGDYSSLLTWSEGSLKVVDVANGALLQQRVAVGNTATLLPTSALGNRKSLLVQNAGAASFWVGSATVTASGATAGIEVPKGGDITLEIGPAVSVYAITASGSINANVLETA